MRRWDFVAAYLQGELLDGEVSYCSPPPGFATALVSGEVPLSVATGRYRKIAKLARFVILSRRRRAQQSLLPRTLLGASYE